MRIRICRVYSYANRSHAHPSALPSIARPIVFPLLTQYNAVYIPIELAFSGQLGKTTAHIAFDFCVDALFLCDVLINFRTVYCASRLYSAHTLARIASARRAHNVHSRTGSLHVPAHSQHTTRMASPSTPTLAPPLT